MPKVGGKHYPYTKAGYAAANKARRGYKDGNSVQPSSSVGRRNEASKEMFKTIEISPTTKLRNLYSAAMFKKLKP